MINAMHTREAPSPHPTRRLRFLRARTVLPVAAPPIEDGAVIIHNGRIEAVGPFQEIRAAWPGVVSDLGEQILLPGLINAHCHLDYTGLRGSIPPPPSFTDWINSINMAKRAITPGDYQRAISEGMEELLRWGTTSVVNLASVPEVLSSLPEPPLRVWWVPELYDLRSPAAALVNEAVASIADFQLTRPGSHRRLRFGLSPHAPYTASPELYRLCAGAATPRGWLLSTHVAESPDEQAMFREGTGALYELLHGIGRPMDDCGRGTVFSSMAQSGLIGPEWLIAHGNEIEPEDVALIRDSPEPWNFVHCPRSHAYFRHRAFPWQALAGAGANLCLGTDSLASNDSLSLFAEMQAAQRGIADESGASLASEQLVKAVTLYPAQALGMAGELGVIAPGAIADLIAIPFDGSPEESCDAVVAHTDPVEWIMLEGTRHV